MAQLALFNEGVRDHFPICGNFCKVLLVAGVFILFSLHMTMVWDLANGAGIPAPSDAIDVCVRLQLHGAIYRPDSFVLMLRYCANLKAIRYESTSLNRIVADKSHRVIVA